MVKLIGLVIWVVFVINCNPFSSPETVHLGVTTLQTGVDPDSAVSYRWILLDRYLVDHDNPIVKSWSNSEFRFYDSTDVSITVKPEGSLRSTNLVEGRHFFVQDSTINVVQVDYIQSGLTLTVTVTNKNFKSIEK